VLHPRLEADTLFVARHARCQLRLVNDCRWPWLIIIPEVAGLEEWHHLPAHLREGVNHHVFDLANILERIMPCDKINIASLGNVVRQLHIHIIARKVGDANWPGPVWGHDQAVPYTREEKHHMITTLQQAISFDTI